MPSTWLRSRLPSVSAGRTPPWRIVDKRHAPRRCRGDALAAAYTRTEVIRDVLKREHIVGKCVARVGELHEPNFLTVQIIERKVPLLVASVEEHACQGQGGTRPSRGRYGAAGRFAHARKLLVRSLASPPLLQAARPVGAGAY